MVPDRREFMLGKEESEPISLGGDLSAIWNESFLGPLHETEESILLGHIILFKLSPVLVLPSAQHWLEERFPSSKPLGRVHCELR